MKYFTITFEPMMIEAKNKKEAEKLLKEDLEKGYYPLIENIYEEE